MSTEISLSLVCPCLSFSLSHSVPLCVTHFSFTVCLSVCLCECYLCLSVSAASSSSYFRSDTVQSQKMMRRRPARGPRRVARPACSSTKASALKPSPVMQPTSQRTDCDGVRPVWLQYVNHRSEAMILNLARYCGSLFARMSTRNFALTVRR